MKKTYLSLVLIFLISISCLDAKSVKIKHITKYSNKGTRSEAEHGYLLINKKELPDFFSVVVMKKKTYKFFQRKNLWGRDGYFLIDTMPNIKISDKYISKKKLKKGWYLGNQKLKKTPSNWIYVEWGKDGKAFVSPIKIPEMIEALHLKTIERMTGLKTILPL